MQAATEDNIIYYVLYYYKDVGIPEPVIVVYGKLKQGPTLEVCTDCTAAQRAFTHLPGVTDLSRLFS